MKSLNKAVVKLIDLISGNYNEVLSGNPWRMEEFEHFENTYINPLSDEDKIKVFRKAYDLLGSENLADNIKQLFYLASIYGVKFSNEYIDILQNETSAKKKEVFFKKAHYYIEERWSSSAKLALSSDAKKMIDDLCKEYGLNSPFDWK
ncbi:hypothetical protein [Marinomonas sp. THO17]|uniref:hypothetical protein n=1 Tax=Marinomonas sp. THO17 TaxID=3149048 RepID=UPI00336BDC39